MNGFCLKGNCYGEFLKLVEVLNVSVWFIGLICLYKMFMLVDNSLWFKKKEC